MTMIGPCALIRIGQTAVLGADDSSWILFRLKRGADTPLDDPIDPKKLRPLGFFRTKAALLRLWAPASSKPCPPAPADHVAEARARIARLEEKLASAQVAHGKAFPQDTPRNATMAMRFRESEAAIGGILAELAGARRDLVDYERAARDREIMAQGTRLFEVIAPDGRRLRQSAASAESLRRSLQAGYEITAEVFPGGMTRPIDPSQPSLFTDFISAFGPELMAWLLSQGVVIRRGDAA